MKKQIVSVLLTATMAAGLLAGCGGSSSEPAAASSAAAETAASSAAAETTGEAKTYALVTKSAGNPFMELLAQGFTEAVEGAGGQVVIQNPESATADAQISAINSLISQGVDSICVSANDANALSAVLQQAKDAGIQVLTTDSDVEASSRSVFVGPAGVDDVAVCLMDAILDISGGEGQYAILSATSQATNQNAWIDSMKALAESDEKYANLELVEVAYGDDEPQKSTDQTQALLQKYPDLKVICAPTTVGIAAAAKVLQDQGSSVKLTGLGLPSEMQAYIGTDDAHSCPYMYLWNNIDLGKLAGYASMALVDGSFTGAEGETLEAGDIGTVTVGTGLNGETVVNVGAPFRFDAENIAEWAELM